MATVSTQEKTVIPFPISNDYRIDVLLGLDPNNFATRWNSPNSVGTPASVTYSFMSSAPTYASDGDKKGFTPFSEEQKTATKQILSLVSQQINITFKEVVNDTPSNFGAMCFGNNSQGETSAGYAFYPDVTAPLGIAGDMYINGDTPSNLQDLTPGTYAYATLVHELCHALGLKHPGNYNAGEPASTEAGNFLIKTEDSGLYTVMSYVDAPQNQQREFLGSYDLLALKYLYGTHSYNDTDTVYKYTDASGQNLILINDTGGTDAIDVSAIVLGAKIDLNAGKFSSVGVLNDGVTAAIDNLSIDFDAVIENVIGTALDDAIIGNSASNQLSGGVGNDNISGGAGSDTITGGAGADTIDGGTGADLTIYTGSRSQYAISTEDGALLLTSASEGVDRVKNVEYFQFSDGKYTLAMLGGSSVTAPVTPNSNAINGTAGNDYYLYGKSTADEINGLAGNDALYGLDGNDTLNGGAGYDYLVGGKGDDTLDGGADIDAVDYYTYDSTGPITVNLALGTATGAGIGADTLNSIETVYGSYYADTLIGDANTNYLCGIDGNDKLDGAGGDDSLWGWYGNDSLTGGAGNDLLYGGYGADTFYFAANQGVDIIEDFYTLQDKITIVAGTNGITTPDQAVSHLSTNAAGAAILDLGQGNTVTLLGVSTLWLTPNMFTIA